MQQISTNSSSFKKHSFCIFPKLNLNRFASTGPYHNYSPGIFSRCVRTLISRFFPLSWQQKLSNRLLNRLRVLSEREHEALWLRRHGNPLCVMNLPEHASLAEVIQKYRTLLKETHPDTRASSLACSAVSDKEMVEQYYLLQEAYRIISNPNSLWYVDGNAESLRLEIFASESALSARKKGTNPTLHRAKLLFRKKYINSGVWAIIAFSMMTAVVIGMIFSEICNYLLVCLVELVDPEFYQFMIKQEKEEERLRLAGEKVNTDPKRLMPIAFSQVLYPGRFITSQNEKL